VRQIRQLNFSRVIFRDVEIIKNLKLLSNIFFRMVMNQILKFFIIKVKK
jgi:hypothetical protein